MPVKPYKLGVSTIRANVLLYGFPGVGKTLLAASAQDSPRMKDVMIVNVEGGLITVANRTDISAVDVKTQTDLEEVFWALADHKQEPYKTIGTVVIDSGSELQTALLEERAAKAVQTGKDRARTVDDVYLEDYGKNTMTLRRLFRWFRDLPVHVIVTALAKPSYPRNVTDKEHAEPSSVAPFFTEKLGESVMGYFDYVWYMYQQGGSRFLLTQDRGVYRAKTRGANFAHELGPRVQIRNIEEGPEAAGMMFPEIIELLYQTEGGKRG